MHKRFILSSSDAKPVLEFNSEKYQFEQNFVQDYPTDYKSRPPTKEPSHFANKMTLTESSNSAKISCHTKFRDNFLIFKGLGIIRVNHVASIMHASSNTSKNQSKRLYQSAYLKK